MVPTDSFGFDSSSRGASGSITWVWGICASGSVNGL